MRCPRCDYSLPIGDRYCGRCGLANPTDGHPVDPLLGLTVAGRYRIDRRIGVGGMGTVYLGTHVRVGQRVAIKVLHERYAGDKALTQRFENEAMTYARVSHPNLVALHDFGRTPDNCYFMVLEYCPGMSLARLVRRQERLDPTLVVEVIIQVAQGLGAAHAAGIVHRDLKPENVMMMEAGPGRYHVKLLDFGIAKRLDDDGPRLTQAGMVFGTPEYMAPEQARGEMVDGRSDIYALGCLLYELLTGDPPFTGSNKLQVMHRQAAERPKPPSAHVPGIPPALEAITLKCLEKRPADRFRTTDEFITALETEFGVDRPTPVPPALRLRQTAAAAELEPVGTGRSTAADTELNLSEERAGPTQLATDKVLINHTSPPERATVAPTRQGLWVVGVVFLTAVGLAAWLFGADDRDPALDRMVTAVPTSEAPERRPDAAPRAPETVAVATDAPPTDAPPTDAPPSVAAEVPPTAAAPVTESPEALAAREAERAAAREAAAREAADREAARREAAAREEARREAAKARKAEAEAARRYDQARQLFSKGKLDEARKAVETLLAGEPRHKEGLALKARIAEIDARIRRGRAAYKRHECSEVEAELKPVVRECPAAAAIDMLARCDEALPPKTEEL